MRKIIISLGILLFACLSYAAPYPDSSVIETINWASTSTIVRKAPGSDNYPTTWVDDTYMYTVWGDGGGFSGTNDYGRVDLGVARISGSASSALYDDYWGYGGIHSDYKVTFGGKSYGILYVNNKLYMLVGGKWGKLNDPDFLYPSGWGGSCWIAQKATRIATSTNYGVSWSLSGSDFWTYQDGVGYPSFLQFGKNYAGNTDGYVYVYSVDVAGGKYGNPKNIILLRVPKKQVDVSNAYQYYAGGGSWSYNSDARKAIIHDSSGVGIPAAIYHSGLGRYLMVVPHGTSNDCLGGAGTGGLGIFDAPNPWGPWTTVIYDDHWLGSNNIFYANIPTKWISGNDFYLVFTGFGSTDIARDAYQHIKGTLMLKSIERHHNKD